MNTMTKTSILLTLLTCLSVSKVINSMEKSYCDDGFLKPKLTKQEQGNEEYQERSDEERSGDEGNIFDTMKKFTEEEAPSGLRDDLYKGSTLQVTLQNGEIGNIFSLPAIWSSENGKSEEKSKNTPYMTLGEFLSGNSLQQGKKDLQQQSYPKEIGVLKVPYAHDPEKGESGIEYQIKVVIHYNTVAMPSLDIVPSKEFEEKQETSEQNVHLDLSLQQLTAFPEQALFDFLQAINLRHNEITEIPAEIVKLGKLQELDLSFNQIKEIPHLPKSLLILNLGHNNLSEFPKTLFHLENLKELILQGNSFPEIPKEITQLVNLEICFLGYNQKLKDLPVETGFQSLENLKCLDIQKCSALPIGILNALRELKKKNTPGVFAKQYGAYFRISGLKELLKVNNISSQQYTFPTFKDLLDRQ